MSVTDDVNPCPAELFVYIFRHLKLELLTQTPASNDEKYLWKIDIPVLNYWIN